MSSYSLNYQIPHITSGLLQKKCEEIKLTEPSRQIYKENPCEVMPLFSIGVETLSWKQNPIEVESQTIPNSRRGVDKIDIILSKIGLEGESSTPSPKYEAEEA